MKTEETHRDKKEINQPPRYALEGLLNGITEENLYGETDFGKDIGKEIVDFGI